MAVIQITTTTEQDRVFTALTNEHNSRIALGGTPLTVLQYFRMRFDEWIGIIVTEYLNRERITKVQAYQLATPEDRALIDSILAKYQ